MVDVNVRGGLLTRTSKLAHTKLLGNSTEEFCCDILLVEGPGCLLSPQQEFRDATRDS